MILGSIESGRPYGRPDFYIRCTPFVLRYSLFTLHYNIYMIFLFDSARYKIDRAWTISTMQDYLDKKRVSPHLTINCIFVGRRKMLHIATTYKHEPEALPVLCFPYITSKRMIFKSDLVPESVRHPGLACPPKRWDPGSVSAPSQLSAPSSPSLILHTDDLHTSLTPPTSLTLSQPNLLGEIFICYPQAVLLAAEKNKKVDDMMTFLLHHAIDNLLLGKEGTHYKGH